MSAEIVTRFAPSPTGYLHIGGARTALFNWAYARRMGGKMLLRIEDTDRERSTEGATAAIYDGMKWLGLNWDGDAISQFSRADRHREVAQTLLAKGKAYCCYATPAELDDMRERMRQVRAHMGAAGKVGGVDLSPIGIQRNAQKNANARIPTLIPDTTRM